MNEPLEATLRRLKEERDEADRRYNAALTAVDRAMPSLPPLDEPLPPADDQRAAELNDAWNILPAPPAAGGVRGRLAGFIWRTIGPYLQRQQAFNSILVDHINRSIAADKTAHRRQVDIIAALRRSLDAVSSLHGQQMVFLQQITAYVDTKDRDSAGGALVLNAALSELAETDAKYRESFAARERRFDARVSALSASHDELRGMIGIAQQAITTLRRELEGRPSEPLRQRTDDHAPAGPDRRDAFSEPLDAYKYLAFEDRFRGSRQLIRERQESYVPFFAGAATALDVLDVGCGRGEFIELLKSHGIRARGIDINPEMVESCRSRGLEAVRADAVGYLETLDDDSLAGLFAAQVVEHLEPGYLLRFLDLAFQKVHPSGVVVLETLNPACWTAFFESYIRDITHRWPLHPETLKYLVTASGFTSVRVEFRSPVPQHDRLQAMTPPADSDAALAELVEAFNANAEKLNSRLFTFMDYAIVARKLAANTGSESGSFTDVP